MYTNTGNATAPTEPPQPPGFKTETYDKPTFHHVPTPKSDSNRRQLRERVLAILRKQRKEMLKTSNNPIAALPPTTLRHGNVTISVVDIADIEDDDPHTYYFSAYIYPRNDESTAYLAHVSDQHPTPSAPSSTGPDWSKLPREYHDLKDAFIPKTAQLPAQTVHDLKIELNNGAKPHFGPLYNLSETELKILHDYIQDMLARGLIRPSTSPYGAPVLFARKKDGSLRLCVDYQRLNNMTKKNVYPLPLIPEMLDRLGQAKIFTKLDLKDAYWHIRIAAGDEHKTAFRTRYGLYEYCIMPFGLSNAPGTFQTHVNETFSDMLDVFLTIYLDDFLIYSTSYNDHVNHVRRVLQRVIDAKLSVNLKKCDFHTTKTEYLGYDVSPTGVSMCTDRIQSILDWAAPTDVSSLRSFLGVANFYRGFIPYYSDITTPLTALFKKNATWKWSDIEQQSFELLKEQFSNGNVIRHFNPTKQLILETDASDFAIAGILSQTFNDGTHPIAMYSRKLRDAEVNYDTHNKELLAIIEALQAWRHWLLGTSSPFHIITDHKNLEYFTTTKMLNRRQVRWSQLLADYNFLLFHRPGSLNTVADSLSRRVQDAFDVEGKRQTNTHRLLPPALFAAVTTDPATIPHRKFEELIRSHYKDDAFYQEIAQDSTSTALEFKINKNFVQLEPHNRFTHSRVAIGRVRPRAGSG